MMTSWLIIERGNETAWDRAAGQMVFLKRYEPDQYQAFINKYQKLWTKEIFDYFMHQIDLVKQKSYIKLIHTTQKDVEDELDQVTICKVANTTLEWQESLDNFSFWTSGVIVVSNVLFPYS
jgi:hypothetical protein